MSQEEVEQTSQYKEAVIATSKGWPESGVGFTNNNTEVLVKILSRQLNTVLFTVTKLRTEVAALREEIKKSKKEAPVDLAQLTAKLDQLHLSPQGASFKQSKGTIKAYRNPFDLLKNIK